MRYCVDAICSVYMCAAQYRSFLYNVHFYMNVNKLSQIDDESVSVGDARTTTYRITLQRHQLSSIDYHNTIQ